MLVGCSDMGEQRSNQIIQNDLQNIYTTENVSKLTIYDAIERGLRYNLDARIAEDDYSVSLSDANLQYLNSLPTITAKREYITRNNDAASTSVSSATGVVSLESSVSSDQTRQTNLLEANWALLDSAINIYKSKSAVNRAAVSEQRLRKVRQNIVMDVYSAFWRAASYQKIRPDVESAIRQADDRLESLDVAEQNGDLPLDRLLSLKTEILSKKQNLQDAYNQLKLSEYELKTLLSIPLNQNIYIKVDDDWLNKNNIPSASLSVEKYVDESLSNRPEIKEELLELQISKRGLVSSVLETIPGLDLIVNYNTDSNSFLENQEWVGFTASLTQNITRILTLPFRYQKAQREIDVANSRRKALVAAVLTQTYIAKSIYDQSYQDYIDQTQIFKTSQKAFNRSQSYRDVGILNGVDNVSQILSFEVARIERFQRYVQAQSAYARFMNTLGYDINKFGMSLSGYHLSQIMDAPQ